MPGTVVRDADAPDLASGGDTSDLNAAGTTNGVIWDAQYPGLLSFALDTPATITGTTPTMDVTIEASSSSTFASDVVTVCKFDTIGDEQSLTFLATGYVNKRYVRAEFVLGGTSPVFTGTTVTPVPVHDRRTESTTA